MRRFGSTFLIFLVFLLATQCVSASITDWYCVDDGDGAIVMDYGSTTLTQIGDEYELAMSGIQYSYPAHMEGDFWTDTELDPIVRILQDVENDTDFAWADYHIAIGMTKEFSILTTGIMAPDGWTWTINAPLAGQPLPGDISPGLGWVGMINFYQGTGDLVGIGDIGTFGFKVSFLGSVAFYTEQIPTPEPTTIVLLGLGALAVMRKHRA